MADTKQQVSLAISGNTAIQAGVTAHTEGVAISFSEDMKMVTGDVNYGVVGAGADIWFAKQQERSVKYRLKAYGYGIPECDTEILLAVHITELSLNKYQVTFNIYRKYAEASAAKQEYLGSRCVCVAVPKPTKSTRDVK